MFPTIEHICEDLAAGRITAEQAVERLKIQAQPSPAADAGEMAERLYTLRLKQRRDSGGFGGYYEWAALANKDKAEGCEIAKAAMPPQAEPEGGE